MDWTIFWTAVAGVATSLTVLGAVMGVVRSSDQRAQDDRFNATEKTLDSIKVQMAEKASKDELNRVVARFERDIDGLRQDTKVGFSEIRGDIKDLRNDIIDLLKKGP